jgi:hypothetical protein
MKEIRLSKKQPGAQDRGKSLSRKREEGERYYSTITFKLN